MSGVIIFAAPCPERHPGARWTQRQLTGVTRVESDDFTIACGPCGTAPMPDPPMPPTAPPAPLIRRGYQWARALVSL